MPEIRPFRGLRYDARKVKRPEAVLAPPYDIINKKEQSALHKKHPNNSIRLELGLERPGDGSRNNKYSRAAKFLQEWKEVGVLAREDRPAVYVYAQDYKEGGRKTARLGFLAAMKIDEKAVRKHENTLAGPKKDRLKLLKETRTNLSPIFGLVEDKPGALQKLLKKSASGRPVLDATVDRVRHRLYVETDPRRLEAIVRVMKSKPMHIADGHHRFEVATQYRKLMQARAARNGGHGSWSATGVRHKSPADSSTKRRDGFANALWRTSADQAGASAPAWNYVLTYFCDCLHNPFRIDPTHRLVSPAGSLSLAQAFKRMAKYGTVESAPSLAAVLSELSATPPADPSRQRRGGRIRPLSGGERSKEYVFGIYAGYCGFALFRPHARFTSKLKNHPVEGLDVSVLHRLIIAPCFGVKKIAKSDKIDFTRDADEAVARVNKGDFKAALFLRATSLHQMLRASHKGMKMPQKSTYFWPKLVTGMVFHELQ